MSPKRLLMKKETLYILSSCSVTIYSPTRHLYLNILPTVHCNLFCLVLSQYHILLDVEIDQLGGTVVQCYSSDLAQRLAIACRGIDCPIRITFGPPLKNSSM